MIKATVEDKHKVVTILANAFDDNKSVNYIIKQDSKRKQRIRRLMEYSFNVCLEFGKVFLSDDKDACGLILQPDNKRTTLRSICRDINLVFTCIGIGNLLKAMTREAKIKALQPNQPNCYLWFIGVSPEVQGKGIGTYLLKEIMNDCGINKRVVCLETSTLRNVPWYEQFGFTIYNQLDLGYQLFFLKKE